MVNFFDDRPGGGGNPNHLDPIGDVITGVKNAYTIGIVMAMPFLAILWLVEKLAPIAIALLAALLKLIYLLIVLIFKLIFLLLKLLLNPFGAFSRSGSHTHLSTRATSFRTGNTGHILYKGGKGWGGAGFRIR